jgi:hypothetical protein
VLARPAFLASAGFGEGVAALQFRQLLFQIHARDYNQPGSGKPRRNAEGGSPKAVIKVLVIVATENFATTTFI